jgi:hypothetical protein
MSNGILVVSRAEWAVVGKMHDPSERKYEIANKLERVC